ncbi:hypothetical protein C2G38_872066 [Gigaspora rosea]|uniref:Uncharacterized protein n=1 Tax=Gigaspora rosea TaxID=44941 RepID=A0A397TWV4_9GLOM|nr:hypothetical protein C2G38_872066 [Gigaspora rosea]
MEIRSFLSLSKFITFLLLILIKKVLGQDPCHLPPTKPPKVIIGYYPAYKLNLRPGIDFNISPSIDYLNYIAFGPNDFVNNGSNLNNPYTLLTYQNDRITELRNYKNKYNLKFQIILSVLLPTDGKNLVQLFNGSGSGSESDSTIPDKRQGQGAQGQGTTQLATNLAYAVNLFNFDGVRLINFVT